MIRPLQAQDITYISPLLCNMYEEHRAIIPNYIPDVDVAKHIQEVWGVIYPNPNYHHYVYEKNQEVIAYIGLSVQKTNVDFIFPSGDTLILDNIIVHPKYRKKGIATELIDFSKQLAKQLGFDSIDLYVLNDFNQTQKFYKSQKFQNVSNYMSVRII